MKNTIAQWKCENISIIRVRTVAKILLYIVDVIICVSPIILLLVIYNVPFILNSKISTFIFLLISGLYFLGEIYSFYVVIRCKLPYKHIFIFTKMLCYLLYILIGYVTTVPEACDILLYANFPWIDIVIILFHSMSTYYLFHYIYILKTLASIFLIIGLGCILILYSVAVNQIIDFRNLEKLVESKYLYQIDREYLHIDKEYLINNNILDKYSNKFLENSQSIDRIIDENLEYIEQCKRIKVEHRLSVNKPKEPIIQLDDLILTLENHKEINILFLDQLDALIYYERLATFCYDLFSGNLSMEKDFYLLLQFLHILIEGCDNNDIIYNYLKYYENINQFFMNIDHSILINNNTIKKMIYAWKNELEFIIDKFKDNMKYEQYKLLNSLCNILPTKTSNKVRINVNNTDNTILWPILTLRIILFYDYYNVFLINEKTIDFPSINIYAITSKYHINNYNMIFKHPPLDSCFFNNIRHKYTLIEY